MAVNPGTVASHAKWAEKFGYEFPICQDPEKRVAAEYGALNSLGGIQRCVFIVDKRGKVAWAKSGLPATDAILAAVDELG